MALTEAANRPEPCNVTLEVSFPAGRAAIAVARAALSGQSRRSGADVSPDSPAATRFVTLGSGPNERIECPIVHDRNPLSAG